MSTSTMNSAHQKTQANMYFGCCLFDPLLAPSSFRHGTILYANINMASSNLGQQKEGLESQESVLGDRSMQSDRPNELTRK
jgi:hypothetical protein